MDSKVDVAELALAAFEHACMNLSRAAPFHKSMSWGAFTQADRTAAMRAALAAAFGGDPEAIAELIAADREYDAARETNFNDVAGIGARRVELAEQRRELALARITGDNNGH